ncbi:MAG: hypothetical protein AM1032_000170 [Mycoplasmataceae bacterium]|nr:MAG: hypothetical protein AM1032_000170 [Mycoplasmataceae bacterium]
MRKIKKIRNYFLLNTIPLITFSILFRILKWKIPGEEKFFMCLENNIEKIDSLMTIFTTSVILSLIIMWVINLGKASFSLKYKHIKNKLFFLNNKIITFLNYVLKALSYIILTISFTSFSRLLLTVAFITFNYMMDKKIEENEELKELKNHPNYFSWKDKNISNIFLYSSLTSLFFPLFSKISKIKFEFIKNFINNLLKSLEDQEGIKMIFNSFKDTSIGKLIFSMIDIVKSTSWLIFWIILLNYLKSSISETIDEFKNFWENVNSIEKRVESLKFFFNNQKAINERLSLIENNNEEKIFISFCYENFLLNPNFIKSYYIEENKIFNPIFIKDLEKIIIFIELVKRNVKNEKEKNFTLYSLFNDYKSFKDLEKYSKEVSNIEK